MRGRYAQAVAGKQSLLSTHEIVVEKSRHIYESI
jgi:hypothetical protein